MGKVRIVLLGSQQNEKITLNCEVGTDFPVKVVKDR